MGDVLLFKLIIFFNLLKVKNIQIMNYLYGKLFERGKLYNKKAKFKSK